MRFLIFIILWLIPFSVASQPIDKKLVTISLNLTYGAVGKDIKVIKVRYFRNKGYYSTKKENIDFIKKLSDSTKLDTSFLNKKVILASGSDDASYKYLTEEMFFDIKDDRVFNKIKKEILLIDKKLVIKGWYVYVYFKKYGDEILHESYTELDIEGNVKKFTVIQ